MPKEISLKLCLLNCITERPGKEVENKVLISKPENDPDREDKQSPISAGSSTRSDREEA